MAASHPYMSAPKSAFWSRAVSANWDPKQLIVTDGPLIRQADKVISAGSCFASNIVPYLQRSGFTYLRTETVHPAFADLEPEAYGYANFSAAYGNIYTTRQLLQLLKRCFAGFSPVEDRWIDGDDIIDSLRPGLRYRARSHREFEALTAQHLRKTSEAFANADVFIFTLGLTEAWLSRKDGTVFPACPGTVAGRFDENQHEFKNFTVSEIIADLDEIIGLLHQVNPTLRHILTVSPVPLIATATVDHVLNATTYSKSVLRTAAGEISKRYADVVYFPAYEIVTGPQAPGDFFENDKRSVSKEGVETVMSALLAHCEVDAERVGADGSYRRVTSGEDTYAGSSALLELSRTIAEAECEEAMADLAAVRTGAVQARESRRCKEMGQPVQIASGEAGRDEGIEDLRGCVSSKNERQTMHSQLVKVAASQRRAELRQAELVLAVEKTRAESEKLQSDFAALKTSLVSDHVAMGQRSEKTVSEREALAAEAKRWFEAAIAITPHHNPLSPRPRGMRRLWLNITCRLGARPHLRLSPSIMADQAYAAGQWELAVRYYRDALELEPNDALVWFRCGFALRAAGKIAEAEEVFKRALDCRPLGKQ